MDIAVFITGFRMRSWLHFAAAGAVAASVLLATSSFAFGADPQGDPIKVGSLNSMTGLNSTFGQSSDRGIRLAAEEQNKAGGVLGRPVEVATGDTESSPDKTSLAVLKLIEQDKVVAVLGEVASSRSIAAAPACQRAKIPLLSPASTNPKVTKLGSYIFRSCFVDDFQGVAIAKFTANDLKLKKAAILTDTKNDYSTGLQKVLEAEFPRLGGEIVAHETYQAGDTNFKTQLTNIKAANPDIVFLPGYYTEAALIVNQARELGLTCPFIGGDGWDSDVTLKQGGAGRQRLLSHRPLLLRRHRPQGRRIRQKIQSQIRRPGTRRDGRPRLRRGKHPFRRHREGKNNGRTRASQRDWRNQKLPCRHG